ncbi:MAG: efflux RND transporter periplasmic adaptor subunit, partial [Candidatus Melainabacteria bacterium]|nr:efflux RND transporter periplasmic adaptor subunit [Candidatus Melainabacteria bacterium]
ISLTNEQIEKIGLTTSAVQHHTLPVEIELTGEVQANPNLTTPVNSLVPGRVESVSVQQGEVVQKGKVLSRIRSDEIGQIENELLDKNIELDAERKQREVKLVLQQKVLNRKKVLFEEKIGAQADVELAESDVEEAKAALQAISAKQAAEIASTKQRLRLYGLPGYEVERLLKTREIQHIFDVCAPRYGIITLRDADPGEMIEAGKTLFNVADLSKVWVVAQVYERDIDKVKEGMPVSVKLQSFPNENHQGKIDFLETTIDEKSRTMPIRATIDNPHLHLKPQMFAKLILQVDTTNSLAVPTQAVQHIGESDVVYTQVKPGSFVEKKVVVGRNLGQLVEVLKGLNATDKVVVHGSLELLGEALDRLSH